MSGLFELDRLVANLFCYFLNVLSSFVATMTSVLKNCTKVRCSFSLLCFPPTLQIPLEIASFNSHTAKTFGGRTVYYSARKNELLKNRMHCCGSAVFYPLLCTTASWYNSFFFCFSDSPVKIHLFSEPPIRVGKKGGHPDLFRSVPIS